MPSRPVSDQEKLSRHDEIITAAKKVFACNGFHATTIADVATEAHLPFEAVYQYFDSTDALFHALIAGAGVRPAHPRRGRPGPEWRSNSATPRCLFAPPCGRHSSSTTPTVPPPSCCSATPTRWTTQFDERLGSIYERFIDDIETLIATAQKRGDVVAAAARLVAYTLTVTDRSHRAPAADHRRRHHRGRGRRTSSSRWSSRGCDPSRPLGGLRNHNGWSAVVRFRRGELTRAECSCIIDGVSTSLGEASTRIQATDPERRETPRVRTAPPGLRVEPKWLPAIFRPDTACSAETLTSGVRFPEIFGFCIPACV